VGKIFDFDKCRAWVAERKPVHVDAGMLQDWWWTSATIYDNGEFVVDHRAWLHSGWATPVFKATLDNGDVIEVECWRDMTQADCDLAEQNAKENREALKAMLKNKE